MTQRFILASGSPRRRDMITSLEINFEIIKPDVDETLIPEESPFDYVRRLSILKAETVADSLAATATILAADTIVLLAADTVGVDGQGDILGKPVGKDAAWDMLRRLRGRDHVVCTAFTLMKVDGQSRQQITELVRTTVHMRQYSDDEIATYIASEDPFDKAGGYAIQNTNFNPAAHINGCYNNVVGLPLCAVKRALAQVGWDGITVSDECDCPAFVFPVK
jgi:MAF protein